jgi:hypothetical protein
MDFKNMKIKGTQHKVDWTHIMYLCYRWHIAVAILRTANYE